MLYRIPPLFFKPPAGTDLSIFIKYCCRPLRIPSRSFRFSGCSGCGTELAPLPVTPEENKIAVYLGMFRAYDFVMFLIHWWMKGFLRKPDSSSGAF